MGDAPLTTRTRVTSPEPAPSAGQRGMVTPRGVMLGVLAVLAASTSAILVRLAGSVSAYEIALWRLVVATVVLTPPMIATGTWQPTRLVGARRFLVYGATLAAHFVTYNLALRYAPIGHVLPLAYTSTVFIAILSAVVLKEPLRRRQLVGIGVVLLGIVILAGFEPHLDRQILIGDGFAILTAIAFALYSLVGRQARHRVPLLGYAVGVYAFAALWTAPAAIAFSHGGFTTGAILAIVGLGLVPGALGHTLYNASLRNLNATVANVLLTQEITMAIVLGWIVLGEAPGLNVVVGAAVMLAGILAVLI